VPPQRSSFTAAFVGSDPYSRLDGGQLHCKLLYKFVVFGRMDGKLTYRFEPVDEGVQVFQRQTLRPRGALKLLGPLIGAAFSRAMVYCLKGIKKLLEARDFLENTIAPLPTECRPTVFYEAPLQHILRNWVRTLQREPPRTAREQLRLRAPASSSSVCLWRSGLSERLSLPPSLLRHLLIARGGAGLESVPSSTLSGKA
jgi:hypothetical protein